MFVRELVVVLACVVGCVVSCSCVMVSWLASICSSAKVFGCVRLCVCVCNCFDWLCMRVNVLACLYV